MSGDCQHCRDLIAENADLRAENADPRKENARLHEMLAAAERLAKTLCAWGNQLEARNAELAERGGRPCKVDPDEVVRRFVALTEMGLGPSAAKAKLIADLEAEGKTITKRRVEQILNALPTPVRIVRTFRYEVDLD